VSARALLGALLGLGTLAVGLWTAWVAAGNYRLARELDRRQRECEALEVWNDNLAHEVLRTEEQLLAELADEGGDGRDGAEGEL
jgi:hypothetical protein